MTARSAIPSTPTGEDPLRLARRYQDARAALCVREEAKDARRPPARDELTLQAMLYNGDLGAEWTATDGRGVVVVDWGHWNREAGPDFKGATVEFGGAERVRGDIELDLDARGWDQHGHATSPDFEDVVLHIFARAPASRYFTRTRAHREVAQVLLPEAAPPPSRTAFAPGPGVARDRALAALRTAAAHRLRTKGRRLAVTAHLHGRHHALFFHLAAGLGYKPNKIPFLLLAQRTGWKRAAAEHGEALLFGLAGFLQPDCFDEGDAETRAYLRGLWDGWWPSAGREARLVLPPSAWKLSGIRPANHPHRRLGALRGIACGLTSLGRAVERADAESFAARLRRLDHPFWNRRWNLRGALLDDGAECALLGEGRVLDLVVNVFYPLAFMERSDVWREFEQVRMMETPARMKQLARWLCPELEPGLARMAWVQQGLVQIGEDFAGTRDPEEICGRILQ